METFEKWLEEYKWEPEGVLDDDMPDAFEAWICELEVAEVMDFAEEWGEKRFLDGKEFVLKAFEPHIRALDTEAFATHIDNDALKGGADYPPVDDSKVE